MERTEILAKLGEIFKMVTGNAAAELTSHDENARLADDLGLNSVGILYLVIAIEEFFHIRFEDVGTSDLKTVGQVVDYIQSKVAQ